MTDFQIERNSNTERQISDMFEEYWESTGVTILNDLWREKWGEYIVDGDENPQPEPDSDLPVEELAKLSVKDDGNDKSFVTPDESVDALDSACNASKGMVDSVSQNSLSL